VVSVVSANPLLLFVVFAKLDEAGGRRARQMTRLS